MKNILLLLTILIASILISACGDEGAFRDAPDTLHPDGSQLSNHAIINNALLPNSLSSLLAQQLLRSTVYIIANKSGNQGSGFVCGDGLVATAYHIVNDDPLDTIWIQPTLAETYYQPHTVYAKSMANDLIVFAVQDLDIVPLTLADSNKVFIGQRIFTLGAPAGMKGSFADGIVSGIRANASTNQNGTVLQITAPTSKGSSGCPVTNHSADVVGIVTFFTLEANDLTFATPSNALRDLLSDATLPPAQATTR